MTYKNIFSFEPSELHTAKKIVEELGKKHEVYFPIKDKAVDLIVTKNLVDGNRKIITVQVKGSRMYETGVEEGLPRFWVRLNRKNLEMYSRKVDFHIFVFYNLIHKTESIPRFKREYIVIPTEDFIIKSENKKGWKRDWLNYYFLLYPNDFILDVRDVSRKNLEAEKKKSWRNYTRYRNAFDLLT